MEPKTIKKRNGKNILSQIEKVALAAKDKNFSVEFMASISKEAEAIGAMLDCTPVQALLFSLIFNLNFTTSSVDIECLSKYMDCSPIMIARHICDLEELCRRKILRFEKSPHMHGRRSNNALSQVSYYVNRTVLDALLNNRKYVPETDKAVDTYDLIAKIRSTMADREKGQLTWDEMEVEIGAILDENCKLPFVRDLRHFKLFLSEQLVFFYVCDEYLDGSESTEFTEVIKSIFPDFRKQLEVRKDLIDGTSNLIRKDLITLEDGFFRSDRNLILKDRALDMLLGNDKNAFVKKQEKKRPDLILSQEIEPKKLFYNPEEERQLDLLTRSLMPANYKKLIRRLGESGMKTGFCVLFHGMPGVGKTESVLQIARQTGRDIRMVVISETKSMWFGESEKLIKGIFDQYRRQVERSEITPILLFNEADGILGSRKQNGSSPVDQTENSIQNIILQEMENLEGIMIATTNLTQNLDKAFERRFLYKIRFDKPDISNRIRIWKERISGLTMKEIKAIATKYEFTGGQIDNISRKMIIHDLLQGPTDFVRLQEFCEEERLGGSNRSAIGFR